VAAAQTLRGGFAGPVNVGVTSSNTTVGTIVNSPAVFNPNDSSKSVQFDPASAGTSTLSVVPPAGFTTPSNLQQLTATVTAPNIGFSLGTSTQIGLDLQVSSQINLALAPPSARDVTVTSNNPAVATITTNPLVEGGPTLTFPGISGTVAGTIYIQGRSLGTTTITVQAPGYNDATLNVTIHPSGFAFQSGTANFSVTAGALNRTIGVQTWRLDPTTLAVAANQALRGGYGSVNLAVTSSNTTVGTIVNSPAVFGANDASKNVQFDPAAAGTSTIRVVQPAGFTTPLNLQQITATVTP
jgi:hypothetical protein